LRFGGTFLLLHNRLPQYIFARGDDFPIFEPDVKALRHAGPVDCSYGSGLYEKDREKAMNEPITAENKKQNCQKPPLSVVRIACEILAGTATGLVVALPLACVIGFLLVYEDLLVYEVSGFAAFGFLATFAAKFAYVFPPLYGLGSAVGVYLVGTRGKQTGSFILTLAGGFLGGLLTLLMFSIGIYISDELILIVFLLFWSLLVLLIPPILATVGFNLRRRYKEPPSS